MKNIAILGSTGSIGCQTLDVVRSHADEFAVYAISARSSVDLLISQAREFLPKVVCIADESKLTQLRDGLEGLPVTCYGGDKAIEEMVEHTEIDIVVAAMVGYAGLRPTIAAIRAGKTIAFANKETLVVAGELVCALAREHNVSLLPVDSEHSAIFQSLMGEDCSQVEKLLLTASGGPFRLMPAKQLASVTAADALKHPNWQMGAKITIDSATMMNKGFEVIEAKWLFSMPVSKIEVLVHPQSIIHSAVQFIDGSVKAQLGMPDMRLPIQFALTYPRREKSDFPRIDFFSLADGLTFYKPDTEKFQCLKLAYEATRMGGNMPCVLNAANEVAVAAFLKGQIGFLQIPCLIEYAMEHIPFNDTPDLEAYMETDKQTRALTEERRENLKFEI